MQFSSDSKHIGQPAEVVFNFLSDLTRLGELMPDQVVNWQASPDKCSFTIQGMTDISLQIDQKLPNSLISLVPYGKSPFAFSLQAHVKDLGDSSDIHITLDADLNPMLAMMAKRPLQNLVQVMADKLTNIAF